MLGKVRMFPGRTQPIFRAQFLGPESPPIFVPGGTPAGWC